MQRDWVRIAERLMRETQLSASQAARLLPTSGSCGTANTSTIVRWIRRGKRGVFLDGYRGSGKSWWTSREALARFFAALSAMDPVAAAADMEERQEVRLDRQMRARAALERIRAACGR